VAEAERLVEESPDDPVARLVLALAQFQDGSTLAAFAASFMPATG